MEKFIGAVDQGTTSTRFMVFDWNGRIVGAEQKEHRQIFSKPGWVEHDPIEIWKNTQHVIRGALSKAGIKGSELAALGVTNQRETTVVWDKNTGEPYYNAVVWQCTRTHEICRNLIEHYGQEAFRAKTGLPVATYFSGPKVRWILDNVSEAERAALKGEALFGTVETWLIWWLTGGPKGGVHVTDVTNASRTMLMDLDTLGWDENLLRALNIPRPMLPGIVPSSDKNIWGFTLKHGPLEHPVPVCGALGDQQAALVGQSCFEPGEAKNTYGTGCFLLLNTGSVRVRSHHGLITTVGYRIDSHDPVYCLEGSVAVAGALVQWLRDNLGIIAKASDIEALAGTVEDNGGTYFVPAFSGLFAPYWRADARGVIAGLTRFVNKGHIARAVLEASAFQTRDIVESMNRDSGVDLRSLKVDGGMVYNDLLMQFQADMLNVPVIRPRTAETTALGAAYAAGLAVGFWPDLECLRRNWSVDKTWLPAMARQEREKKYNGWKKAVERTFDWVELQ
jgi:glycerol kinase